MVSCSCVRQGDYVAYAARQLAVRQVYEEVHVDPTIELDKTVRDWLKELGEEDSDLD